MRGEEGKEGQSVEPASWGQQVGDSRWGTEWRRGTVISADLEIIQPAILSCDYEAKVRALREGLPLETNGFSPRDCDECLPPLAGHWTGSPVMLGLFSAAGRLETHTCTHTPEPQPL